MQSKSTVPPLSDLFREFLDGLDEKAYRAAAEVGLFCYHDSVPPVPDRIHWLLIDGEPHPVQEIAQKQFEGHLYQVGLYVLRHRGRKIIPSYSEGRFFYRLEPEGDQRNDGLNKDQLVTSAECLFAIEAARGIDAVDAVLRVLPEYLNLDSSQWKSLRSDLVDYRDDMPREDGIAIFDGRARSIDVDPRPA